MDSFSALHLDLTTPVTLHRMYLPPPPTPQKKTKKPPFSVCEKALRDLAKEGKLVSFHLTIVTGVTRLLACYITLWQQSAESVLVYFCHANPSLDLYVLCVLLKYCVPLLGKL